MSSAHGSDNNNTNGNQPKKVTASSRSEIKAVGNQDLKQLVRKAVAMPAAAVRAAMTTPTTAVAAARVGYDVISRLLSLLESGVAIDQAALKLTKTAIDTAGITDNGTLLAFNKALNHITVLNDVLTRIVSFHRTYQDSIASIDAPAKTLSTTKSSPGSVLDSTLVVFGKNYFDTIASVDVSSKSLSTTKTSQGYVDDSTLVTFGKVNPDVIAVSESFSFILSFGRSYTEIISSDDFLSRQFSKVRADTAAFVDTPVKLISKQNSDNFNTEETSVRGIGKARADTLSLGELRSLNFEKISQEILNSNDDSTLLFTKKIQDFIYAIESNVLSYTADTYNNTETQLSTISDNLSRVISFVRLFQDTATLSEQVGKSVTTTKADTYSATEDLSTYVSKPKNEPLVVNQQLTRVVSFNRLFTETNTAVDTLTRIISFRRNYTDIGLSVDAPAKTLSKAPFVDSSQVADVLTKTMLFPRGATDTASSSDSFSRLVSFSRAFNSGSNAVDTADIISTIKQYNRAFTEYAPASDVLSRNWTALRPQSEAMQAADVFGKVVNYQRTTNELLNAAEIFLRVATYNRAYSDTAAVAETFTKTMLFARIPADQATAQQTLSRYFSKVLSEVLRISDSYYFSTIYEPPAYPPADTQSITDSVRKLVSFIRNYADTAAVSQTDTIQYTKVAGANNFNIWSDFNDLLVSYELCQYYADYRIEYLTLTETSAKTLYKRVGPFTYYYDATWTDFNELSLGLDTDQELAQEFWRQAYSSDHELILTTDIFTKVVNYSRTQADTYNATDAAGRTLSRNVGDNIANVFNDFAELYYSNEFTSTEGGAGAQVLLTNTYPTYSVSIVTAGAGYTIGKVYTINTSLGGQCTFTVNGINGSGGITSVNNITGTPNGTLLRTDNSYLTDVAQLRLGGATDQEILQYNITTYLYYGVTETVDVGPKANEAKRNVVGQDLLFTLKPTTRGDSATYVETSSKQITKVAVDFYPQGFWNDYNELTFGSLTFDQDLTQSFIKSKPTSASAADVSSRATLGGIKVNTETLNFADLPLLLIKPNKADISNVVEVRSLTVQKSAGEMQPNTWQDYNEFLFSGLNGVDYGARFDLVLLPETFAKNFTKTLYFDSYIWRDYNELTFATVTDQDITFTWGDRQYTEISRVADDARRLIGKNNSEIIQVPETFSKEISIFGGDGRNASFFRDWLGIFPIGEHSPTGEPILDEELTLTFAPGSKTDFSLAADSRTKLITKAPIRRAPAFWYDFAELSFATEYDQELVQFSDNIRPETFEVTDLLVKLWTINRTFTDSITVTDSALLSVNGGPSFTLLYGTNDHAYSASALGKLIGVSAGEVPSYYSTWQDYTEVQLALELAQYYYRGTDSTVDIGKITDVKTNQFTKQGGRVQNIVTWFDDDLYFDRDLKQLFDQDYVTEMMRMVDLPLITYGKNQSEILNVPDPMVRNIDKNGIGDTTVAVAQNIVAPLYIQNFSDYDENIRFGNYPDYKIDKATVSDTRGNYFTKQGGFSPVFTWNDSFEVTRSVYDNTLLTYGNYAPSNNTFAQTIFDKYLDHIVYEELEEQIRTPYRTENMDAVDVFAKTVNYVRSYADTYSASSDPSKQLGKPASDTSSTTQTNTTYFNKVAAPKIADIWDDYVELHPFNDMVQNYPDYRVEFLTTVDVRTKSFTKAPSDIARASESLLFVKGKNPSHQVVLPELLGKSYAKPLGDQSELRYTDYNEILSFDPRLLEFGQFRNYKFDTARANDGRSNTYTKVGGAYRTHIWTDFEELTTPFNELTQYWPDYVTEYMTAGTDVTISLNKKVSENQRAIDAGVARLFKANIGYAENSPLYFAEDYESSTVSSTF